MAAVRSWTMMRRFGGVEQGGSGRHRAFDRERAAAGDDRRGDRSDRVAGSRAEARRRRRRWLGRSAAWHCRAFRDLPTADPDPITVGRTLAAGPLTGDARQAKVLALPNRARREAGGRVGHDPDGPCVVVDEERDVAARRLDGTALGHALDRHEPGLDTLAEGSPVNDDRGRQGGGTDDPDGREWRGPRAGHRDPPGHRSASSSFRGRVAASCLHADHDFGGRVLDRDQGGRPEPAGFGRRPLRPP